MLGANITLNWPSTIEFGEGKLERLIEHLKDNKRVFFLVDQHIVGKIDPITSKLKSMGISTQVSTEIVPEPPLEALEQLLEPVRSFAPDAIVGVGGGSTLDLAKLVAVLFDGSQNVMDIIGVGLVKDRKVKLITVSTTSGTGSEVTPIAVLTDVQQKLKKGVVSQFLIPDVAIVDPLLTLSVPKSITAATGMDAIVHCIEAYTNRFAHHIIDNIALEGIRLLSKNLESAVKTGDDKQARSACALGSMYGGMCLGPVNTAAVHAMAYPLGGEFKISHGVSNSVLLPFVMIYNLPSCTAKYANIAKAIGVERKAGETDETVAMNGILRLREIALNCEIPSNIKMLDVPEDAIDSMAHSALKVTRLMANNPREIDFDSAKEIYTKAYKGIL
ncbi:MAG: iron-containing alcohol dehydrogenase [Bacteriovoracaceae bacterium]|nr:iron-containing alcohol dehydrogenase [Bacteriovoracaceae bacterium]